jgi:hypothetical protein
MVRAQIANAIINLPITNRTAIPERQYRRNELCLGVRSSKDNKTKGPFIS